MRSNPGKNVTIYEIPALVKKPQLAAMTPKNILSGFECTGTWPLYVSPREIHDIPKAALRKATNSRKRKTKRILTATPVRDSIAVLKTETEKKNISQTKKAKKKLFYEKKATKSLIEISSEEENIEIHYDDNSDFSMDKNIVEGDYVIVNVRGRSRVVQYIARVDEVDVNEYEGVFYKNFLDALHTMKPSHLL